MPSHYFLPLLPLTPPLFVKFVLPHSLIIPQPHPPIPFCHDTLGCKMPKKQQMAPMKSSIISAGKPCGTNLAALGVEMEGSYDMLWTDDGREKVTSCWGTRSWAKSSHINRMDTPISVKLPNISINSGKPLIEKTACLLDIDFFQVLILVYSQGPEGGLVLFPLDIRRLQPGGRMKAHSKLATNSILPVDPVRHCLVSGASGVVNITASIAKLHQFKCESLCHATSYDIMNTGF